MKLLIDLEALAKHSVTLNQYALAWLLVDGSPHAKNPTYDSLSEPTFKYPYEWDIFHDATQTAHDIFSLLGDNWIYIDNQLDGTRYSFTEKFRKIFRVPGGRRLARPEAEEAWQRFKEAYPKRDGTRALHTEIRKAEAKFIRECMNGKLDPVQVLDGLGMELTQRKAAAAADQFFPAQKSIYAWLNAEIWKAYLDDEDAPLLEGGANYGL